MREANLLYILVWKGSGARGEDRRYSLLEKGKEKQMRRVTQITAPGEPKLIRTVRGAGYALKGA